MQPQSGPQSKVSYIWEESMATLPYSAGVSLHSHTSVSEESLTFIHKMGTEMAVFAPLFKRYEKRAAELYGLKLDFLKGNWRPPLVPRMAYEVERKQIARLGLDAHVSITDHDTIEACLLLRTLPVARRIPMSVEWSAPYGTTCFHMGIHNLPSADAAGWMERFARFTEAPSDEVLHGMFAELHAIPQVLIVLNHPLWDLYAIGQKAHEAELERFLTVNGEFMHALELNGLRHAKENRDVMRLARRWSQVVISGGDRHGLEPNANINLTNATSFNEFVHEIRVERKSHVLFMEQYKKPWEQRITDSTIDAITDYPQFAQGWQRWDERAFHPDADGVMRPMSELWVGGRPPRALMVSIQIVRLLRHRTFSMWLSLAFPGVNRVGVEREIVPDLSV
ncbi:PHP domain-containing protein [Granulicella tundricola]|uniref:PHP domain protein n=1 Tax=Granulicella tundricola (strain ATCC BAA-1859 / DSM 23138 / MP5ACTX9) TaxID=1198114 RepID=E8WV65_GRATM|nr:hypothetical protein [Granulicella tundricola]ADW67240.1 hypothetical protein AciX9_0166 [Granulicella tundricola MP5ACTX9]